MGVVFRGGQVRKISDGKVYAMKILKKEMVVKRKQYDHTLSERRILESINHPFIVSLRYAFQSELKLYMVFGALPQRGGCCCLGGFGSLAHPTGH